MIILMTEKASRTHLVCPQDVKVEDHFIPPWVSEKAADREDTKCLPLKNDQRWEQ